MNTSHRLVVPVLLAALATAPLSAAPQAAAPAAAATAAPAASAAPAAAAVAPADTGDIFEHVDVEVVNVDVFVTDKKGFPVRDLRRDDFVLKVDGHPLKVDFFAPPADAPLPEKDLDPGLAVDLGQPAGAPPPPEPATVVLYVDQAALRPGPKGVSIQALETFTTKHMPPRAKVIVAAYDHSLRFFTRPTTDVAEIRAALEKIRKMAPAGMMNQLQQGALVNDIQSLAGQGGMLRSSARDMTRVEMEMLADQQALEQRQAFRALGDLLGTLTGSEGKVVLLLASGGFVTRPAAHLADIWQESFGDGDPNAILSGTGSAMDPNAVMLRTELSRLLRVAQASRVTVYSIEGGEVEGGMPDPSQQESSLTNAMQGAMATLEANGNLRGLAIATGGRSFRATPDLGKDLAVVGTDMGASYSLGFSAGPDLRAGFHRIDVEVKRPDLRVRHREGFRRRSEDERATDSALAAATLGGGANPFGVAVATGEAKLTANKKSYLVPVVARVPLKALTLIPDGDRQAGKVAFHYVVRDDQNHVVTFESRDQSLQIPAADLPAALDKVIAYNVSMPLAPGEYQVAVAVRDEVGGGTSTVVAPIHVGKK